MARRSSDGGCGCLVLFLLLITVPAVLDSIFSGCGSSGAAPAPTGPVPTFTFTIPNFNPGPGIVCRDGWVSHSSGRGTCSHHGGEG